MLNIFIEKKRFTWFLLIFIVVVGLFVMFNISKESLPEIKIPVVGVSVAYPGASSLDVEELVTNPIEKQLIRGLRDVESINSNSSEGFSSITVEFGSSVDIDKALRDVNDEVDRIVNDLPSDALDPVIQEFSFDDQPVFIVSVSSKEAFTQLSDTADRVEDMFLNINGVSRVEFSGIPERKINIIVNKKDLSAYNLNITDVARVIGQTDISFPLGSIVQDGVSYNVSVDNSISSVDDIRNIIVGTNSSGSLIYIKDIARVEDGLASYTSLSRLSVNSSKPQQSITFSIFKQVGFDITKVTEDARNSVDSLKKEFPDMEFITLIDMGEEVSTDISNLTKSALITILLVVIVLSLGLGFRESIIAGISVPLSFLLAFIGLYLTGNTINFISLFALILAIGLLVDASVVIIEGITEARERGLSADDAIRSTLKEFSAPVIAGTMTTLVVFIPLASLSGVTGQFIRSIPLTIIFVLVGSLIVGLIFVPLLSTIDFSKHNDGFFGRFLDKLGEKRERFIKRLSSWYQRNLVSLLESKRFGKRLIWGLVGLFVGSLMLVGTGLIKSEFFPADDFNQITITAELPSGSQLKDMSEAVKPLESFLQKYELVDSFVTQIRPSNADITVIITDKDYGFEALAGVRGFLATNDTRAKFLATSPASGPSVGAPVSIQVKGDNYEKVATTTSEIEKTLKSIEGAIDVSSDISETSLGFLINLNVKKVSDVGLDVASLSSIVRSALFGSEVATISRNGNDIDVILISAINENYTTSDTTNYVSIDGLRSLPIRTAVGEIPLGVLMKESINGTNPSIKHTDGDRIVSVSGYLAEGVVLSDVTSAFTEKMKDVKIDSGVEWSLGGDAEQSAESGQELLIALFIGILLVVGVLIFQFDSLRNTFFIVSVIPLGLIGVLFGLFFFGQTLSFTAMLGFVALVGIVVNNSIILIDVITSLKKQNGRTHREVVVEGSVSRLRPILLTTITTIAGMVPLLFSSPVWKPLALAIITGLMFAVVLTLFLVPLLFYKWGRK